MGRAVNAFLPCKAMSYPQQLPVSSVHMLEAVVCCVVPTVPTLPVPLLKCLTLHLTHQPPSPSHDRVCVGGQGADIECVRARVCMCGIPGYE